MRSVSVWCSAILSTSPSTDSREPGAAPVAESKSTRPASYPSSTMRAAPSASTAAECLEVADAGGAGVRRAARDRPLRARCLHDTTGGRAVAAPVRVFVRARERRSEVHEAEEVSRFVDEHGALEIRGRLGALRRPGDRVLEDDERRSRDPHAEGLVAELFVLLALAGEVDDAHRGERSG